MKTKENITKKSKDFDTVKTFRNIKNKISEDLFGKNADEIKEYLRKNSLKFKTL